MKSYTDIEQSRKLAEILSIDSANMCYALPYEEGDKPLLEQGGFGSTPCWSLSALLSILPSVIKRKGERMFLTLEKAGAYNLYYKSPDRLDELWETKEDAIDACYELILKLHEQKLM